MKKLSESIVERVNKVVEEYNHDAFKALAKVKGQGSKGKVKLKAVNDNNSQAGE